MDKYKAILITVKCDECGHEQLTMIPLEISKEDWLKTQEKHGEMITETTMKLIFSYCTILIIKFYIMDMNIKNGKNMLSFY